MPATPTAVCAFVSLAAGERHRSAVDRDLRAHAVLPAADLAPSAGYLRQKPPA